MLEPACGVGNFFGMLPESMSQSRLYGVELDSITGRMARQLYPDARIEITGFEKTNRKIFLMSPSAMCLLAITRWRTGRSTSTGF